MSMAIDRGGPVVRTPQTPRNWMHANAPGVSFRALRFAADESSPIGGRDLRKETRDARSRRARAVVLATVCLLAVAGTLSFGHGAYLYAKAQLAQWLLHAAWSETRTAGIAVKPWPWADTHPVARLLAPRQGADLLVLAGASGRTLAFGPGHLDGSALPGDAGNAIITAHRDTHFRFLRNLAPGDTIRVERHDGSVHAFRIESSYVADAAALDLPRDTAVPTLTLVTCYPFDALQPGGPLRYVVVATASPAT